MALHPAARKLLESPVLVHMATVDSDGKPQVTCAWAGLNEDDEIVIATLFDQRKLRNIRKDPRVTLSLEGHEANAIGMKDYLVVYGSAEVVEGGAPELLQELAKSYVGEGVKFPPMDDPPPGYVTKVKVEKLGGMGPWMEKGA